MFPLRILTRASLRLPYPRFCRFVRHTLVPRYPVWIKIQKQMAVITVLLFQIVLAMSVYAEVQADSCDTSEKPTGCEVQPPDNADYAIQQLEMSLVSATSNLTLYPGLTAVFSFEVNNSILPMDFSPFAYINGCQDNKRCTLESLSVLVCIPLIMSHCLMMEWKCPSILYHVDCRPDYVTTLLHTSQC